MCSPSTSFLKPQTCSLTSGGRSIDSFTHGVVIVVRGVPRPGSGFLCLPGPGGFATAARQVHRARRCACDRRSDKIGSLRRQPQSSRCVDV